MMTGVEQKLSQLQKDYSEKVSQTNSIKQLDRLFLELFGKNGHMTKLPKHFPSLSKEQLQVIGPLFNKIKNDLEDRIEKRRAEVREDIYKRLVNEKFDLTDVQVKKRQGHLHPIDKFESEIVDLFSKLGFAQYDAPQIDTDYNNFEVLNIPADHPARDLWDTLYIDTSHIGYITNQLLLRTHTSNSQIHIMNNFTPPIRMMCLGRCFRYENLDARHEHTFDQFELFYVDKNLSMANLQYLSEYFLKHFLGQSTKVRLRPKYYPFVEPGVGIDGECMFCKGKGCKVCGQIGWLELGGAGMIHPQVLKNGGIDPNKYSGIAWGPGLERILMLRLGVEDLRLFRSGNLNFLQEL